MFFIFIFFKKKKQEKDQVFFDTLEIKHIALVKCYGGKI